MYVGTDVIIVLEMQGGDIDVKVLLSCLVIYLPFGSINSKFISAIRKRLIR